MKKTNLSTQVRTCLLYTSSYGQFMKFEPLTLVPFDLEGVDPEQMEAGERKLLNQYHALVYEKISPYLNEEEQSWLKKATQEI